MLSANFTIILIYEHCSRARHFCCCAPTV